MPPGAMFGGSRAISSRDTAPMRRATNWKNGSHRSATVQVRGSTRAARTGASDANRTSAMSVARRLVSDVRRDQRTSNCVTPLKPEHAVARLPHALPAGADLIGTDGANPGLLLIRPR